jgi:hypothetical protein
MKKIFYLKDEKEFIQSFDSPDEIITWVYRFGTERMFSTALNELIESTYFLN